MTLNDRIKAKQDLIITELVSLQGDLEALEHLAKYFDVELFATKNVGIHTKSVNIAVRLELLSKVWFIITRVTIFRVAATTRVTFSMPANHVIAPLFYELLQRCQLR